MALNINWRFAGPQNINVPQSNFLNSLDKNIQNALGIKKEFEKKRDDNEMIRLMTEDAENKLKDLYKQESELIKEIESLSEDEYIANKTHYDDALKKIDEQINSAEKEVTDARMSANQFKTTGTTDFFRWKKDKEYASEVANINRDILDQQTKESKLSDLEYEIKSKENEYNRSADTDKQIELTDEINLLRKRYNKISGENRYPVFVGTQKNNGKPNVDGTPKSDDTPKDSGGIQTPKWITTAINKLAWEENLKDSEAVKAIQGEINKQNFNAGTELSQELNNKINELNVEHIKNEINTLEWQENLKDSDTVKAIQAFIGKHIIPNSQTELNTALNDKIKNLNAAKVKNAKGAAKSKEDTKDDLATMSKENNVTELLKYYNNAKNKDEELKALAKTYLINILRETNKPGLHLNNNTKSKAALIKYKDDAAMKTFINDNAGAINK